MNYFFLKIYSTILFQRDISIFPLLLCILSEVISTEKKIDCILLMRLILYMIIKKCSKILNFFWFYQPSTTNGETYVELRENFRVFLPCYINVINNWNSVILIIIFTNQKIIKENVLTDFRYFQIVIRTTSHKPYVKSNFLAFFRNKKYYIHIKS